MKGFGLWVFLFMVGAALICICVSSKSTSFSVLDTAVINHKEDLRLPMKSRKLKDNDYTTRHKKKTDAGSLDLEDYAPTDPVPNSKASIHPGPIQHGTPVMPYIPKPTPPAPDHP